MQTLFKNTRAYKLMKADVEKGQLGHAYLLLLDDARNLKNALKIFAKLAFGCDEPTSLASRRIADLIDAESFADCLFFPQADKKFMVEDAEKIAEECTLKPIEGDIKAFVACDFADANAVSQNKLLKLLEEPPENVVFLLGSTTAFPLLPTVLSRVQKLEIPPFDAKELADCLARTYENGYAKEDYLLCASACGGSLGTAQNMLEGGAYKELLNDVFSLCLARKSDLPALIKRIGETKKKKELLSLLRLVFRDALLIKTGVGDKHIFLQAETSRLQKTAEKYTPATLIRAQEFIAQAELETTFNAVFPQCLEVLITKIQQS